MFYVTATFYTPGTHALNTCERRSCVRSARSLAIGWRGVITLLGVTAGKAKHNSSNVRGVTAGRWDATPVVIIGGLRYRIIADTVVATALLVSGGRGLKKTAETWRVASCSPRLSCDAIMPFTITSLQFGFT